MSSGPQDRVTASESPSCPVVDAPPESPQFSKTSYIISANSADREISEKTISCVSCRKRKLRCDRVKPRCGTCTRLQHECDFPERKRNLGSKRRNMKELEARLAQVETKLVSQVKAHKSQSRRKRPSPSNIEEAQDVDLDASDVTMDSGFGNEQSDFGFVPPAPSIPVGNLTSQELISLGLDEPLPARHMIDELEKLYFEHFNVTMPMIHKSRYYASLDRATHNMGPPICLRYAMWTQGASFSEAFAEYEDVLYQRARKYVEAAEMKGSGESFTTLYHTQTWVMISFYEAKRTYFSKSWMSTGRMVRLSHMLGLHRLDGDNSDAKQILPPPRDWIEKEERRRTFWAAFYGDRWASSGTGWPMCIDDSDILTNLPASEESFERGVEEKTISLAQALTPGGAPHISSFAGVIISAALLGHNFQHLHRSGPNERPDDWGGGEFWKRHRGLDNMLSKTFLFLPDHLRIPNALRDMNVVFMHMNIHASIICLHQAAIQTAERHEISHTVIIQCQTRSLLAAQEITKIMRSCSHLDPSKMNTWVGFFLYLAAGVCLQNATSGSPSPESLDNLEFILAAMDALGQKHTVTKHFTAQLELDMEASGLGKSANRQVFSTRSPATEMVPGRPKNLDTIHFSFLHSGDTLTTVRDAQPCAEGDIQTGHEWLGKIKGAPKQKPFEGRTDKVHSFLEFGRQPDGRPHLETSSSRNSSNPTMSCNNTLMPAMTPMRPQSNAPKEDHSRSYTNSGLLPSNGTVPTLDHSPHLSIRFPFRSTEPSYEEIPVTQGSWPQPQPGIEQPACVMTDPTLYNLESLNSTRDSEFDALLDGIVWDLHHTQD